MPAVQAGSPQDRGEPHWDKREERKEASVTMPLLGSAKPLTQCAPASQCVPSTHFNVSFRDCCSVLSLRHFLASFLSSSTLSSCLVHSLYAVQPALLLQGSPQQQREDSHLQRCVCVCLSVWCETQCACMSHDIM